MHKNDHDVWRYDHDLVMVIKRAADLEPGDTLVLLQIENWHTTSDVIDTVNVANGAVIVFARYREHVFPEDELVVIWRESPRG